MAEPASQQTKQTFPYYGWLGLLLIAVFWWINWSWAGLRTHWAFFPMWLGYILTVDAWVFSRKGTSIWHRNKAFFAVLFLISVPSWWLFELINARTVYWSYAARERFTDLEYFCFASLCFSTVLPAVMATAELVGSSRWLQRTQDGPRIGKDKRTMGFMFTAGWLMLAIMLLWPNEFPAFLWVSLYFILEPINVWCGYPSLVDATAHRDWRTVLALWLGCLICGFFWEMWNIWSFPKWRYHLAYFDFWYVFEMPLLGYFGYLPFALELYALYHLVVGALGLRQGKNLLQIIPGKKA